MWTKPESLISASRLDVFARVDFVRAQLLDQSGLWGRTLYRSFLIATGVNDSYAENGTKISVSDYFLEFSQLIKSMKEQGYKKEFGAIPVTPAGITNGAHRLATALELSLPVFVSTASEPFSSYDYRFMRKRQLATIFIDAMAFNLIRACQNTRSVVVFGESREVVDAIENEVRKTAGVVIRKHIELTEIGKRRVIQLAYDHNEWWNRSKLLEKMTSERFDGSPAHCDFIFTQESDISSLSARKASLRKLLPSSHFERRIHGTDNHFDTKFLGEFALNPNSILFANTAPLGSEDRIIAILKDLVPQSDLATTESSWCIDGSSVLELFGLRQANDIDFIVCNDSQAPAILRKAGTDHAEEYVHGFVDPFEIIADPRNHLIYKGLKFISLRAQLVNKIDQPDSNSVRDVHLIVDATNAERGLYQSLDTQLSGSMSRLRFRFISLTDRLLRYLPNGMERRIRLIISNIRVLVE